MCAVVLIQLRGESILFPVEQLINKVRSGQGQSLVSGVEAAQRKPITQICKVTSTDDKGQMEEAFSHVHCGPELLRLCPAGFIKCT